MARPKLTTHPQDEHGERK